MRSKKQIEVGLWRDLKSPIFYEGWRATGSPPLASEKEAPGKQGKPPGAESQRLGPTAGAGSKGLVGYVRSCIAALGSLFMLPSVQQEQRLGCEADRYEDPFQMETSWKQTHVSH